VLTAAGSVVVFAVLAHIARMSSADRRASDRTRRYAFIGIVPRVASLHDALRSPRCCSGEYAVHREKSTAFRPSFAARAMIMENGGTRVYHRDAGVSE
jgi:hypothetical protein